MPHRKIQFLIVVGTLLAPSIVLGFCEDPKSGISGYRVPLLEEVESSIAIIVGEVVDERRVHDIPENPDLYFSIFTIRVDQQLKGSVPDRITFRMDLDSARYPMEVGEKHLLFIRSWPRKIDSADYLVDSCGNSDVLPRGDAVVAEVVAALDATEADTLVIEDTEQAACVVLKNHIAKVEGLPDGKPYPGWYCDFTTQENPLVRIVGLRANDPSSPPGAIDGTLVGWFAVARKSTLVFEYDINEERIVPLSKAYYGSAKQDPNAEHHKSSE